MTTEYLIKVSDKETGNEVGFWHDAGGQPMIFVVKAKAFKCADACNEGWPHQRYEVYKLTKLNNPNDD